MELNQEEILEKELKTIKFQLQQINDNLSGGLTSRNLASFRNTYVINAQDSLDASYPMYVHFNIIDEMVKIVSVKVSFWILNYRAYSTAAASGGGSTPTSSSGGGQTTSSGGGQTTSSGGGQTSSAAGGGVSGIFVQTKDAAGHITSWHENNMDQTHTHTVANHDHTVANHDHTVDNHDHTVTISAHVHSITYGIHEEENSPTIKFYVSENAGVTYSDVFGGYTIDKSGLNITSLLTEAGSKIIKFTSTTRTRLSVQIEIKLDIKAR